MIVAYDGNIPIGCASFKRYDEECAEVKRVFVKQAYRGRGISKKLMELLEKAAREQGYCYLILESGEPLAAAMGSYTGKQDIRSFRIMDSMRIWKILSV